MFNRKKIERLEKDITKLGSMYLEIKNKSDIINYFREQGTLIYII